MAQSMKQVAPILASAFTSLATNAAVAAPVQPGTLCQLDEQVMFSCAVKSGKKLLSLCGSKDLTDQTGYLKYRFGLPGQIELEFPTQRQDSQKSFRYAHYYRAQVDRFSVSFTNKGHTYTVFDNYEGDSTPAVHEVGLELTLPGQKEHTLLCDGTGSGKLHDLRAIVPCDKEDPLNMGECPS